LSNGAWVPAMAVDIVAVKRDAFAALVDRHVVRRTAQQAGLDLPEMITTEVWVPLTSGERKKLKMAEAIPGQYGYFLRNEATRNGTAAGGSPLADPAVRQILGKFGQDKVVVYAENLPVLKDVTNLLDAAGIGWVKVEGKMSARSREMAITRHRTEPNVRVFLGTKMIERGLNLQHARVLMTLSPSDNPASEEQRARRIRRIGSPCSVAHHVVFLADSDHERARVARLAGKEAMRMSLGAA